MNTTLRTLGFLLCLVAPVLAARGGTEPGLVDPIVPTEAGFVAFTSYGVQFSADGRSFSVSGKLTKQTPKQAVRVPGGTVAAAWDALYETDAEGRMKEAPFPCEQVIDLAGDGKTAVAMANHSSVYTWRKAGDWQRCFIEELADFRHITYALGRYWITGGAYAGEEETIAALWSSPDGVKWTRVELPQFPSDPSGDYVSSPSLFPNLAGIPGCVLAFDPYGKAVVTRDGKTWKWVQMPPEKMGGRSELYADGNRLVRETTKDYKVIESLTSIDGEKWVPLVKNLDWFSWRALSDGNRTWFQVYAKQGEPGAIIAEELFRNPAQFAAAQEKFRLAAAAAEAEKARLLAEAKAQAEKQAAEAKLAAELKAAEAARLAEQKATEAKSLADQQAREENLKQIVAALEAFDRNVGATDDFARMGKPMAVLVKALEAAGQTKLADATAAVSGEYLLKLGGVRGVFEYMMAAPEKRVALIAKPLTPAQRGLLKPLGAARVAELYQTPVDQAAVASSEAQWPSSTRAKDSKGSMQSGWAAVDPAKLRRAIAKGNDAASFDLATAYATGQGASKDQVLSAFWRAVFGKLHPGMPDGQKDRVAALAFLVRVGAPVYRADEAVETLGKNRGRLTDQIVADLEKTAEDGSNIALAYLEDNQETIALRKEGLAFGQIYTADLKRDARHADITTKAKAQGLNSRQITQLLDKDTAFMARAMNTDTSQVANTSSGSAYAESMAEADWEASNRDAAQADEGDAQDSANPALLTLAPAELNRMVKAMQDFDEETYYYTETFSEWGATLGDLVTALDASPNRALAEAAFGMATGLIKVKGGAEGFAAYYDRIPENRHPAAMSVLSPVQREFVQKRGAVPADWPTAERKPGRILFLADGMYDAAKIRAALARGINGAAFDLATGEVLADDEALTLFWAGVGGRLVPGTVGQKDEAQIVRLVTEAGSPAALYVRGMELAKKQGRDAPEVIAMLQQSAEGGYQPAETAIENLESEKTMAAHAAKKVEEGKVIASGATRAEVTGTGANGLQWLKLKGVMENLSGLSFSGGVYAAPGDKGTLYFSADGFQWEITSLGTSSNIETLTHDGERWVAVPFAGKPGLYLSADRKTWQPSERISLDNYTFAARRGVFWAAGRFLGLGSYRHGHIDANPDEQLKEWDGQISNWSNGPCVTFSYGDRIYLVLEKGQLFGTDNGEYWEPLGDFSFNKPEYAYYAEGNGTSVIGLQKRPGLDAEMQLWVEHEGAGWRTVQPPFKELKGLAYGLGRFVAIGGKMTAGEWALYESTDAETWTKVGSLKGAATSLTYGSAGFLAAGGEGELAIYRPAALPEKSTYRRPVTPIPEIEFVDFGTNYSGQGKYRTATGPTTPDQIRERDLRLLLPKAKAGDAVAKRELALAIVEGKYARSNPWRAELWLKEAMAAGDPSAARGYAMLLHQWKPETPMTRIEELYRESAAKGDEVAKTWLGDHKIYADNIAKAKAGDPEAIMRVVPLLLNGNGVDKDEKAAGSFLYAAADKGNVPAIMQLAEGFEKEVAAKVVANRRYLSNDTYRRWLTVAADAGDLLALRKLAFNFSQGANDLPKDDKLAYTYGLKLAKRGDADGMVFVGGALLEGRGVAKDETAGRSWITQAAEKGHAGAKAWLDQQAVQAQRTSNRASKDGRVDGVAPEVFAALEQIQAAPAAAFDDPALLAVFNAVWRDAEYSLVEEDLAQEIGNAARPLVVTATDGRKLSFTKPLPAAAAAGFANILPVGFDATNVQYYFTLWPQTANAGLLVAACRIGDQQHAMVQQGLAKMLFDMARQPEPQNMKALAAYFDQLNASYQAADPRVQKEFLNLVERATHYANLAAKNVGNNALGVYEGRTKYWTAP